MIDIGSIEEESCLESDDLLRGLNCLASLDILDGKKRGLHIRNKINKIRQSSVTLHLKQSFLVPIELDSAKSSIGFLVSY